MTNDKKHTVFVYILLPVLGALWGVLSYFYYKWKVPIYAACVALTILAVFALRFLSQKDGTPKKKALIRSAVFTGIFTAAYFLIALLINNVIFKAGHSDYTIEIMLPMFIIFLIFLAVRFRKSSGNKSGKAGTVCATALGAILAVVVTISPILNSRILPSFWEKYGGKAAAPAVSTSYTKTEAEKMDTADFFVAPDGNDENPGTAEQPFATIEKAKNAVRSLDKTGRNGITVAVKAGEYRVSDILFTAEDGGTEQCPVTYCAYGDGEVVLNGGVTLTPDLFVPVTDESVLSRFSDAAKDKILCADIKALGITAEQYGKLYTIGSYNTAAKYDGDYVGPIYSELFVNDKRMTLARYPDSGWLGTGDVVEVGYGRESDGSLTAKAGWDDVRNPAPDVYKIDRELAERVASWKTLDDVWMFGFWKYDWADASTPIGAFDKENLTISPKFVSTYGAKKDAPYYFFNVLEELDAPGEWYLDRENGVIYLYPPEELTDAVIDLSLTTDSIIQIENADYLTLRGFTLKGTRGDGVTTTGDHITIEQCLIKNIAGSAISVSGSENLVRDNEITRTGKAGISISGGDCETLTPGNSRAENNLIHDWSEIYMTYQPAVSLGGCGNVCAHNEIYNSPHEAITYGGNNHVIEYNNISRVCLLSDDAGAIYAGRSWISYGTVIRYNAISDLGSGEHKPAGIYLDDALSGQTVYGNILVNVPHIGIQLGGGRDLDVRNNIIINTNVTPFTYDQRAIDGVFGGWFNHSSMQDGDMWQALYNSPWQTDTWKNAFPQMTRFSDDFENTDDPDFVPNPACSTVSGNVVLSVSKRLGAIDEKAAKFSDISGNAVFSIKKISDLFTDAENGDYTLRENSPIYDIIPDFEQIPMENIGRVGSR